jgi:hypothetical protein
MKSANVKCFSKGYEDNFYHFVVQQLHGLRLYSLDNNYEKLNFYYDGPYTKIVKEIPFLNLFTKSEEPADCVVVKPIGTLDRDKKRKCKLVTHSNYLKDLFLSKITKNNSKHVLIAQRANNRIIKNDDELFLELKKFGDTRIVTLDSLSFMAQIEAIYNSKIIISAHGAGLTHMLFASPGTIFIEVYSKGFHGHYPYKDMARILDLRWDYVEAYYSSSEFYSKEDLSFIASYKTESSGKIPANVLLSPKHRRLRQLIRDPRYIKCSVKEVRDKINNLNLSKPGFKM